MRNILLLLIITLLCGCEERVIPTDAIYDPNRFIIESCEISSNKNFIYYSLVSVPRKYGVNFTILDSVNKFKVGDELTLTKINK